MRRAVEALTIQVDTIDEKIKLTASFGVASPISGFEESIDSLIMQADSAMYKAKSTGRNRVCTSE
jgi:diguanylate cyclase (GGDEF)-like protein